MLNTWRNPNSPTRECEPRKGAHGHFRRLIQLIQHIKHLRWTWRGRWKLDIHPMDETRHWTRPELIQRLRTLYDIVTLFVYTQNHSYTLHCTTEQVPKQTWFPQCFPQLNLMPSIFLVPSLWQPRWGVPNPGVWAGTAGLHHQSWVGIVFSWNRCFVGSTALWSWRHIDHRWS